MLVLGAQSARAFFLDVQITKHCVSLWETAAAPPFSWCGREGICDAVRVPLQGSIFSSGALSLSLFQFLTILFPRHSAHADPPRGENLPPVASRAPIRVDMWACPRAMCVPLTLSVLSSSSFRAKKMPQMQDEIEFVDYCDDSQRSADPRVNSAKTSKKSKLWQQI